MVKKHLRRLLPKAHEFHKDRYLRLFGKLLHKPNLWHLNRDSVAVAVSVGLFMAFVPLPFQMLLAAGTAIALDCNLPIAVVMVWVTNPLTMPPMFFAAYKVGAWLLNEPSRVIEFELSFHWLIAKLETIGVPLLLGCLVLGVASAIIGNVAVRVLWRLHVMRRWRERREKRANRQSAL